MPESNPYAPPRARPDPGPRRRSPLPTLGRVGAVIAGFALLAAPTRPAPDVPQHHGQMAAKALGAFLVVAAFLPIGRRVGDGQPPEAL